MKYHFICTYCAVYTVHHTNFFLMFSHLSYIPYKNQLQFLLLLQYNKIFGAHILTLKHVRNIVSFCTRSKYIYFFSLSMLWNILFLIICFHCVSNFLYMNILLQNDKERSNVWVGKRVILKTRSFHVSFFIYFSSNNTVIENLGICNE